MSNNEPVIKACAFCGQPWPKEVDGQYKCSGCGRSFTVDSHDGTWPKVSRTGIILEVPPGSIPDTQTQPFVHTATTSNSPVIIPEPGAAQTTYTAKVASKEPEKTATYTSKAVKKSTPEPVTDETGTPASGR